MGPLDPIYEDAVRQLGESQGWEFIYRIIHERIDEVVEDKRRQLFSLEGAYANDLAKIVSDYPGWNIAFEKRPNGTFHMTGRVRRRGPDEQDAEVAAEIRQQQVEMEKRFREAFEKHRQGWTAHGARLNITTEITQNKDKGEGEE